MTNVLHAVSYTAQWTAAIRALEGDRGEAGLFHDDLAHDLAQPEGFDLLEKYRGSGVQDFVAIRTKYVDDSIKEILQKNSITQVVFIAAGMDTRAFRLSWAFNASNIKLFEVDHGPLLAEKRRKLSKLGAVPQVERIEVEADLTKPWLDSLISTSFQPNLATLWIVEGLLFFLEEVQVRSLLEVLRRASANGSILVTDMVNHALLKNPMAAVFLAKLRADGTPWKFGTDDPGAFLAQTGWDISDLKEPVQTTAGKARWPYPLQEKAVKCAPRSWLIQATVTTMHSKYNM